MTHFVFPVRPPGASSIGGFSFIWTISMFYVKNSEAVNPQQRIVLMNRSTVLFGLAVVLYAAFVISNFNSVSMNLDHDTRSATIGDWAVVIDDTYATGATPPRRVITLQSIQDASIKIMGYDRRACGHWDEIVMVSAGQTNIMSSAEYDRAFRLLNEMLDARMSPTIKWQRIGTPH
jgi:hypothetical protein